jgi:hypothetical protein
VTADAIVMGFSEQAMVVRNETAVLILDTFWVAADS